MKACGIVAEYNPFHNGHAYQISCVRQHLKPDVVIAVMSGNFLQRGEPAIVDKWTRALMALAGGVDLVVELPVHFSTQPADFFAKGAVQILNELEVDYLSFGVEEGSAKDFLRGAFWMVKNEQAISRAIVKHQKMSIPYAQQMEQVLFGLAPDFPLPLNSPNNQLGFAYAQAIVRQKLAEQIKLFPLRREGASYDDVALRRDVSIASATAIRKALLEKRKVRSYLPAASFRDLEKAKERFVTWEDYFPLLKYQLTVQSAESLRAIYQMTEGLEHRLKEQVKQATTFEGFLKRVKTKRYTWTRLQRLLVYVLLQFSKKQMETCLEKKPAVRVLGFNEAGRLYLNQKKHQLNVPLIANVNQKTKQAIATDVLAGEIYALGNERIKKQDFMRHPIKFD